MNRRSTLTGRPWWHRAARPHNGLVDIGHAAGADELPHRVQTVQRFADQVIHDAPP